MGIISINTGTAGQEHVDPVRVKIISTDSLSTVTTEGYLDNAAKQGFTIDTTDVIDMIYDYDVSTRVGTYAVFLPTISNNGSITLSLDVSQGDVLLPVVDGNFAVYNGTTGQIKDAGYLPTDATKTKVVMAGSAVQVGYIAKYADVSGTIDDTAGTAINAGNLQAGLSGTAGAVIAYPATAANGFLELLPVNAGGAFNTIISNSTMGQTSTISIPDPAAATAQFVVAPSALVSGNLVKASGTAGLVVDAGAKIIANTTGTYAGGGTSNTFTATGLTVASKGSAVIRASTNSVSITKALPGTNTLAITFSADPGAGTTVDYIYVTAAQS